MGYTKLDKPFKEMRDVIGELFLLLNAYVQQTNDQALFERFAARLSAVYVHRIQPSFI